MSSGAAAVKAQAEALQEQGRSGLAGLDAATAHAGALAAQGREQLNGAKASAGVLQSEGQAQIDAINGQAESLAAEGKAQLDSAKAQALAQAGAMKAQAQAHLDGVKSQAGELKAKGQAQLDAAKAQAVAQADALKAQGQAHAEAAKSQALAQADAVKARALGEVEARKAQALEQAEAVKAQALAQAEAAKSQALAQADALKAEGQAQLDAAKAEALGQAEELKAEAAGMAQAALGAASSGLGKLFSGALGSMADVVAKAAEAAGLDGVAEQLASAAEKRAVAFGDSFVDDVTDAVEGAQRSLSQRFRGGVRRSLSMRNRMRFGGGGNDEGEEDDGPSALTEGLQLYAETGKQRSLRADARALVEAVAGQAEVREWRLRCSLPRSVLEAAARYGFGRLLVSKGQGGLGLTLDNTLPVFETIGAADLALAGLLAAHNAAAFLLATECTSKLHEKLLRQCKDLGSLAALAVSEAPGGSDELSTATYAEKDLSGQYYTLSGCKAWVAGAAAADVFLVLVRTGVEARRGLTLFTVTKNMPGVSVGKPQVLEGWRSTPVAPLSFNKVTVRTECLVGREGHGLEILELAQDVQRVWLAAAAAAHGEASLSAAVEAVRTHPAALLLGKSLDRPTHQLDVVKARTELQAAQFMARAAAQQLDVKAPSGPADAAAAKVFAVRAAQRAVEAAVRIRGWDGLGAAEPAHAAQSDLAAADFVAGPPDALYGRIFGEVFRMVGQ
ncbi:hypothetical protein HXX76_013981 [Chlamydomonas incerta]|uniref:Uncharacterized protein n=1 Tax=Chlamydomonas incerta TaxID=51695 RepID=A0A835SHP0_CHLIN|nr:hypothetical protein HXX76_013981 [Chlamydomonas incerta]|eukprot:KAG2425072.1 hypothetical protein HXX76_013981 [Chlamydomonas incerta]